MQSCHSVRWAFRILTVAAVMCIAPAMTLALPNFGPLPTPPLYPPGFVIHIATGPGVDPPPLPPLPYADPLPSPDLHHWQTEISYGPANPPGPIMFDVFLVTPTAGVFAFNLFLPALGSGVLFDVTFPDLPEVGLWTLSEVNATPFSVAMDSVVLEYPGPPPVPVPVAPGVLPPMPIAGAVFSPPLLGLTPSVTLTITPEPATLSLLAPVLIFAGRRRRA